MCDIRLACHIAKLELMRTDGSQKILLGAGLRQDGPGPGPQPVELLSHQNQDRKEVDTNHCKKRIVQIKEKGVVYNT